MRGKAVLLGDNIGGDMIISSEHLANQDGSVTKYLFESVRPDFSAVYRPGDLIVAGKNFGCGSSREQVFHALKDAQITCVIAKSINRQFYRNGINMGILPLVCDAEIRDGDLLDVDVEKGALVVNGTKEYALCPFPDQLREVIRDGGLLNHFRKCHSLS